MEPTILHHKIESICLVNAMIGDSAAGPDGSCIEMISALALYEACSARTGVLPQRPITDPSMARLYPETYVLP
jgi:hypothetical protein